MTLQIPERTALVLGGGGLKGFAHIGVLKAFEERGIRPALYAGTSIGSLIASAYLGGLPLDAMAERARALRRRDLFRINHMGMLLERMRSPSLYLEHPLRTLCVDNCPPGTFEDLPQTLLVNTVDLERGTQVVWGLPGLRDVSVIDAVYASCALPGAFPPGSVGGRVCVDGGTIDNLPAAVAALDMDAIIAVDVGSSELTHETEITNQGFAAMYMRAATIMMHALQTRPLETWTGQPMLLIRPKVGHRGWFSFHDFDEVIEAGYAAACTALDQVGDALLSSGGIYPRRRVDVTVDRAKCIGCGLCVALAPRLMARNASGKAYVTCSPVEWSPAEGDFVHQCPTGAILVRPERRKSKRGSGERRGERLGSRD
ncbi:MAG TPA: patatin-like phospholipase family protein [Gemmatimonadaceae bacterium]|nr:patatin-like phospholipase family protein [Gemmatimonadaceae bacterium]